MTARSAYKPLQSARENKEAPGGGLGVTAGALYDCRARQCIPETMWGGSLVPPKNSLLKKQFAEK
jgi:hypothetical protein